jgi:hypothetical protein
MRLGKTKWPRRSSLWMKHVTSFTQGDAMFRTCLYAAAFVLLTGPALPAQESAAKPADIDLVLCLDVSSSMNGLIDSAKARLWEIVNELAKAKPTPNLRVALYSYGHNTYDAKTGWVKKDLDFTQDLDQVNEKLFGLRTNGGTELVARVTRAALEQLAWSTDPKALKIVFVCGNEPANQDKENTLKDIAEKAVRQGIVVNTIFCGAEGAGVQTGWRDFALLGEGRYAAINQNKAVVTVATPVDKKIAELSVKLNDTYCFVGGQREALEANQRLQDANAAKLGAAVAAERAVTKAGGLYRFRDDLVEKAQKNEKLELDKVADDDLPEALKKLPAAEREKHIKELAAKRTAIQKEILELNRERERFLREATAKQPTAPGTAGLGEALRETIRTQAKGKGIRLND